MPEQQPKSFPVLIQKTLLFFGERLAIILFFLFVLFLFFSGNIPQVLSKQEPAVTKTTATWYTHTDFSVKTSETTREQDEIAEVIVTPTPTPTPQPVNPNSDGIWLQLANCESHQNWSENTGNGYYGGLQFSTGAWQSVGGTGLPSSASQSEQIMRGRMLQAARGWSPWNACARHLGLL